MNGVLRGMRQAARWLLVALLAVAGASHLSWGRRGYRIVVPEWATRSTGLTKDDIVVGSGVVELLLAGAVAAIPRQRSVGWLVAAFFVAVLPGNVHQWRTGRSAPMLRTDRARLIRVLLQPVLVAWALWSTRGGKR